MGITNRAGKGMEINFAEPGSGKGNGDEELGVGENGVEKDISVHF